MAVSVNEKEIIFDSLLNQKKTQNTNSKLIKVPLQEINTIYMHHWDTEKNFGWLGSNPRGMILAWYLVELKLKDNNGAYFINTLFVTKKNQQEFAQLLGQLK